MTFDLYQEAILEELKNLQHTGVLVNPMSTIHETNASCGDEVTVFLNFDQDKKRITELAWQGTGCAISQAAMSLLSEKIIGMKVDEVKNLDKVDLENLLGLQEPISYGRVKCLMLGLQAVKKAVARS